MLFFFSGTKQCNTICWYWNRKCSGIFLCYSIYRSSVPSETCWFYYTEFVYGKSVIRIV